MVYNRFIELGRVVLLRKRDAKKGEANNAIAVVIDVIDHTRCVVHGPTTGVPRQTVNYNDIMVTDLVVEDVTRGVRTKALTKRIEAADMVAKWEKTAWAKKLAKRASRQNMSDFDRFKVMVQRKKRSYIVGREVRKLRK
eukprot:Clim_evm3s218 gene=Clim_evmTU3s218